MEKAEDIRHTLGNKQIYELRKETIERIFGTAKEQHGFRYTQSVGKARMEMKAGLTFAVYESEKASQNTGTKRTKILNCLYYFARNKRKVIFNRKVVLEIISSTSFVYSLTKSSQGDNLVQIIQFK